MDFKTAHKNWYRNLPLRNRIFEIFYVRFVNKYIENLSNRSDLLIFENEFQIKYWSKHYEIYFQSINNKSNSVLFSSEPTLSDAYRWYAGYAYIPINNILRDEDKNYSDNTRLFKIIDLLSSELNDFPVKNKLIVSRRISTYNLKIWLNNIKPIKGMKIKDLGFLSTSLNLFSRSNPDDTLSNVIVKNQAIILIEIPAGTKAIYLSAGEQSLQTPVNEHELLIKNGSKLLIEKVISFLGNYIITAKIIS